MYIDSRANQEVLDSNYIILLIAENVHFVGSDSASAEFSNGSAFVSLGIRNHAFFVYHNGHIPLIDLYVQRQSTSKVSGYAKLRNLL